MPDVTAVFHSFWHWYIASTLRQSMSKSDHDRALTSNAMFCQDYMLLVWILLKHFGKSSSIYFFNFQDCPLDSEVFFYLFVYLLSMELAIPA